MMYDGSFGSYVLVVIFYKVIGNSDDVFECIVK